MTFDDVAETANGVAASGPAASGVAEEASAEELAAEHIEDVEEPMEPEEAGPSWQLVTVVAVEMDLPSPHPVIVLRESHLSGRELRLPVGLAEGSAVAAALHGVPPPRPLTHDLFAEVLDHHLVRVEAVRITFRRGVVYFAELDTVGSKGRVVLPCRPSDALALALRQRLPTPVLVAERLFDVEPEAFDPSS